MFWAACVRRPVFMTTVLLLPPVVVFIATDFAARVVELAVGLRFLTRGDDAVGLGLGLVSLNLLFVPFDLRGFAARNRSVFQPVGDAVLLVLLAAVNARRIPAVAMDFAARVVKLAVEPRALTRRDDVVGLGLGLVSLYLLFLPFDLRGFAARNRSVFQPVGDAFLLVLLAAVNASSLCLRISDRAKPDHSDYGACQQMKLFHYLYRPSWRADVQLRRQP